MKYKLRAFDKKTTKYNTEKKEFELPYLDEIIEGPIISTDDWESLHSFFVTFNTWTRDLQIGLEYIEDSE